MTDLEPDAQSEWAAAFVAVQADLPDIKKTKTAKIETSKGGYSYKFADLADIIAEVRPVLNAQGLAVVQDVSGNVSVETRIYHKAGHVETFGPIEFPVQGDARAAGSAITYLRRYALAAALGIAPDEDKDGEMPAPEPEPDWWHAHVEDMGWDNVLQATNELRAEHKLPSVPDLVNAPRPSQASLAKILKRARELKSAGSSGNGTTTGSGPSSSSSPEAASSPQPKEDANW